MEEIMSKLETALTLVGGPTVLIEMAGFRLLTDPTFDPPGSYNPSAVTLTKQKGPALAAEEIGRIDAVLLSHDQHADNLDRSGRALLDKAGAVFTTRAGAERLGGTVRGLAPWETVTLGTADGGRLFITAAPARHGPPGIEPIAGDVIGFALGLEAPGDAIYVTGDTVWYEGVAETARRFKPRAVLLFAGSAKTRGAFHLTMDCNDAIETAHAFPDARIVPVHNEGWAHFTESQAELAHAFAVLGLTARLELLEPGRPMRLEI
jgi:L-ascorbate metabolism protein UlaG (beta-lactamase superfamily)